MGRLSSQPSIHSQLILVGDQQTLSFDSDFRIFEMFTPAILDFGPSLFLRPSAKALRAIAVGALAVIAVGFLALFKSPHDPNGCYGEPPHIDLPDAPRLLPPLITQVMTPTMVDPFNRCPVQFCTGDYKLR